MLLTVSVLSVCCTLLTLVYHRHHTHTFYWCSPWKDWCTCRQVRHRQACPTSSHGGYVSCWKPQICYEMYRQICTVIECHKSVMKCTDRSALWQNATQMTKQTCTRMKKSKKKASPGKLYHCHIVSTDVLWPGCCDNFLRLLKIRFFILLLLCPLKTTGVRTCDFSITSPAL